MRTIYKIAIFIIIFLLNSNLKSYSQSNTDTVFHSPKRATIYSTILPGFGQYYNQKYWKIPVVYIGIGTLTYFIIDNHKEFNRFKTAYQLRINGGEDEFLGLYNEQALLNEMNRWRTFRDYCIVGTALIYILQIIDANVDAHLFDFDVGDNLTIKLMPNQINNNPFSMPTVLSLGCTIKF